MSLFSKNKWTKDILQKLLQRLIQKLLQEVPSKIEKNPRNSPRFYLGISTRIPQKNTRKKFLHDFFFKNIPWIYFKILFRDCNENTLAIFQTLIIGAFALLFFFFRNFVIFILPLRIPSGILFGFLKNKKHL